MTYNIMVVHRPDRIFAVTVTAALMLDWVPEFFFGADVGYVSGTKLIAMPLILLHMIVYHKDYLRSHYGMFFVSALLAGVGGGVLLGTVPWGRFWELVPIAFVLLFYMKPRSDEDVLTILRVCFWTSLIVPLTLILSFAGLFAPSSVTEAQNVFRMVAGPSYSSYGLYIVFIFASVGGILLERPSSRLSVVGISFAAGFLVLGLMGITLTALRSALLASVSCLCTALFLGRSRFKSNKMAIFSVICVLLLVGFVLRDRVAVMTDTLSYRTRMIEGDPNIAIRQQFYELFFLNIVSNVNIVAPGMDLVRTQVGEITHFILGEAYFDGGLVFLIAVIWGVLGAGYRLWRRYTDQCDASRNIGVNAMLMSLLIGSMVYLSFQPGLRTRQFYVILGLCLSNGIYSRNCRRMLAKTRRSISVEAWRGNAT